MKFLGFIIFSLVALAYIWNGKDNFNKKEWVVFFRKIIFYLSRHFYSGFRVDRIAGNFPLDDKRRW